VTTARPSSAAPDPELVGQWFAQFRATPTRTLRNRLVEAHLHLVDHHVTRFARSSGTAADDLRQTALIALLRAVERFDPGHGATFRTFASRTIDGELKRHLRDRTWTVRPPRRAQERSLHVRRSGDELAQRLGRAPTVSELAEEVGCTAEEVLEAIEAGRARSAVGLEAPGPSGTPDSALVRLLGAIDPGFADVDGREELSAALAGLGRRERLVLHLRFVDDLSQPEIADQVGVSQSYVSRLLRTSLEQLREELSPS
jgi:RNA polymerase sigma-B factor